MSNLTAVPSRPPVETGTRRRVLASSPAFVLAAAIVGLGLFASVTPTPLYHTYSELWRLHPLTLTLVYATYAVGVLLALLVAGTVSDLAGRRPVLLVAVAGLIVSTLLFAFAPSVAWLFAARALQGIATGLALSAAGAALLELHPRRDPSAAGLANAVASTAGIALGILVSAWLVQYDWAPRALPYLAQLALLAIVAVGVVAMPEPLAVRGRIRWSIQRPRVPASLRGPFAIASLAVIASWSLGGLYFSLGPALGARLLDTSNVVISSAGIVAVATTATLSQLVLRRVPPWLGASAGSTALAFGVALIAYAAGAGSGPVFLVGSAVAGLGFGIGFLGGLRLLIGAIPPAERASVMAAFYLVAYSALSVPAVLAGLVVRDLGLELTFGVFGGLVGVVALVTAVAAWRQRVRD